MKKRILTGGILLSLSLMMAVPAQAAVLEYQDAVNVMKQDNKTPEIRTIKINAKRSAKLVEYEEDLYISAKAAMIRQLPSEKSKAVKKLVLGDEVHQTGICDNGWTQISYTGADKKEQIGYVDGGKLSDNSQIQKVKEEVTVNTDFNVLDYPGMKDGLELGEVIEDDEVTRTGICNKVWSRISFKDIEGKQVTGFIPTSYMNVEEETEEETEEADTEEGMIHKTAGESVFVDAVDGVTETMDGVEVQDGVLVGDIEDVPANAKLKSLGTFRITHYCPCSICCGPWADGITSTGVTAQTNHTIAVEPSQIPYGSKVVINGQVYTAEDCGGGITENCIDIYVASHEEAYEKGVYYTDVYLIQ